MPLALIALETGEDIELIADRFGEAVQLDDIGLRVISAPSARAFFAELREQAARLEEQSRHRQEEAARESGPVHPGIRRPANADTALTAFEIMRGVDAEEEQSDPSRRVSPREEFLLQRLGPPQRVVTEEGK